MFLHTDSHIDHVSQMIVAYVLGRFHARGNFFIEPLILPEFLGRVECGLYGPAMGDPAVVEADVRYERRGDRTWKSRLVARPTRQTSTVTVVAGPYDGFACVLFTIYGGPVAPREPGDPSIKSESERIKSEEFWAEHALAV